MIVHYFPEIYSIGLCVLESLLGPIVLTAVGGGLAISNILALMIAMFVPKLSFLSASATNTILIGPDVAMTAIGSGTWRPMVYIL